MNFKVNKGPFLRNKRSTTSIMLELFAVLCVIWGVSIGYYAYTLNLAAGLRVFSIGAISIVTTLLIDVIVSLFKGKRKIKDILSFVLKSYSYVTAIIFALCLPAGTSYYVVVIGSLVATLIGKYVFGGFGNNIFNPAIIGRIFVGLSFGDKLNTLKVVNKTGVDVSTGGTLTASIDWVSGKSSETNNLIDMFLGDYQGAIGETFTALLIVAGIYLIIRGIVNYRLMIGYLLTATLCSFGIALVNKVGFDSMGEYLLTTISTGGLMFASVFMITDPVTSPKSQDGKIIYASLAGFLAIFIRVFSSYPEEVMFSIALANMVTPLIDSSIKGNTFEHLTKRYIRIVSVIVICFGLSCAYAALENVEESETAQVYQENNILDIGGVVNE